MNRDNGKKSAMLEKSLSATVANNVKYRIDGSDAMLSCPVCGDETRVGWLAFGANSYCRKCNALLRRGDPVMLDKLKIKEKKPFDSVIFFRLSLIFMVIAVLLHLVSTSLVFWYDSCYAAAALLALPPLFAGRPRRWWLFPVALVLPVAAVAVQMVFGVQLAPRYKYTVWEQPVVNANEILIEFLHRNLFGGRDDVSMASELMEMNQRLDMRASGKKVQDEPLPSASSPAATVPEVKPSGPGQPSGGGIVNNVRNRLQKKANSEEREKALTEETGEFR